MIAILITAIVAIVLIAVILAIIIYNQMLLLNQINKRLLLMTKESIEKERYTMEEMQERLDEFEKEFPNANLTQSQINDALGEDDEPFDPHTFDTSKLEE